MKNTLNLLFIFLISSLILGCSPSEKDIAFAKKLDTIVAGNYIKQEIINQLSAYMVESTESYTKYKYILRGSNNMQYRQYFITVDRDQKVLSVYREVWVDY